MWSSLTRTHDTDLFPSCFTWKEAQNEKKKVFRRKPKTLFAFSIANKQIKSWKKQLKSGRRRWWNARGRRWNENALGEDLFTSIQKIIYLRKKALVWKLLIFRRQTEDLQGKKDVRVPRNTWTWPSPTGFGYECEPQVGWEWIPESLKIFHLMHRSFSCRFARWRLKWNACNGFWWMRNGIRARL